MLTAEAVAAAQIGECNAAFQIGERIKTTYGDGEYTQFQGHPAIMSCASRMRR